MCHRWLPWHMEGRKPKVREKSHCDKACRAGKRHFSLFNARSPPACLPASIEYLTAANYEVAIQVEHPFSVYRGTPHRLGA